MGGSKVTIPTTKLELGTKEAKLSTVDKAKVSAAPVLTLSLASTCLPEALWIKLCARFLSG